MEQPVKIDVAAVSKEIRSSSDYYKNGRFTARGQDYMNMLSELASLQDAGQAFNINTEEGAFTIIKGEGSTQEGIGLNERVNNFYGSIRADKRRKAIVSDILFRADRSKLYQTPEQPEFNTPDVAVLQTTESNNDSNSTSLEPSLTSLKDLNDDGVLPKEKQISISAPNFKFGFFDKGREHIYKSTSSASGSNGGTNNSVSINTDQNPTVSPKILSTIYNPGTINTYSQHFRTMNSELTPIKEELNKMSSAIKEANELYNNLKAKDNNRNSEEESQYNNALQSLQAAKTAYKNLVGQAANIIDKYTTPKGIKDFLDIDKQYVRKTVEGAIKPVKFVSEHDVDFIGYGNKLKQDLLNREKEALNNFVSDKVLKTFEDFDLAIPKVEITDAFKSVVNKYVNDYKTTGQLKDLDKEIEKANEGVKLLREKAKTKVLAPNEIENFEAFRLELIKDRKLIMDHYGSMEAFYTALKQGKAKFQQGGVLKFQTGTRLNYGLNNPYIKKDAYDYELPYDFEPDLGSLLPAPPLRFQPINKSFNTGLDNPHFNKENPIAGLDPLPKGSNKGGDGGGNKMNLWSKFKFDSKGAGSYAPVLSQSLLQWMLANKADKEPVAHVQPEVVAAVNAPTMGASRFALDPAITLNAEYTINQSLPRTNMSSDPVINAIRGLAMNNVALTQRNRFADTAANFGAQQDAKVEQTGWKNIQIIGANMQRQNEAAVRNAANRVRLQEFNAKEQARRSSERLANFNAIGQQINSYAAKRASMAEQMAYRSQLGAQERKAAMLEYLQRAALFETDPIKKAQLEKQIEIYGSK